MKKVLFLILFLQMGMKVQAQSLIDEDFQRIVAGALAEETSHCPEIRYAGAVVMEVATGNVVVNVSLLYKDGEFVKCNNGNTQYVPCGLGRSALYLAMMPIANPYMVVDAKDGLYVDTDGYIIEDHNHKRGGYGQIQIQRSFSVNSDIGILKCAEKVFEKDMKTYTQAINKTGIFFGAKVSENSDKRWNSRDILGYTSPMSLLQMTAWCNAVAGGKMLIRMDEKDPTTPYDSISSSKEALESLRLAMRECVTDGLGSKMNSEHVKVAGMTNISPKGVDGYKGRFAACFLPYEDTKPKYTVGVYIWRKDTGYANPSNVARKVIDWIAFNRLNKHPYLSFSNSQITKHSVDWVHPAEK